MKIVMNPTKEMKMKLRIAEYFDSIVVPWFRLEQWDVIAERWAYVHGDQSLPKLEAMAERLLATPCVPRIVKEFSDEPNPLVDKPDVIA
jgi:hypothetical protein